LLVPYKYQAKRIKMFKRKNKSGSTQSLIGDLGDTMKTVVPPPIQLDLELNIRVTNNDTDNEITHDLESRIHATDNPNLKTYTAFTKNSPFDKILSSITNDKLKLAAKTKETAMKTRVPELCKKFYNTMMFEKQNITRRIWKAMTYINKELSFHKINQSVEPLKNFSDTFTLLTPKQRVICLKLFPCENQKIFWPTKQWPYEHHGMSFISKNSSSPLPLIDS